MKALRIGATSINEVSFCDQAALFLMVSGQKSALLRHPGVPKPTTIAVNAIGVNNDALEVTKKTAIRGGALFAARTIKAKRKADQKMIGFAEGRKRNFSKKQLSNNTNGKYDHDSQTSVRHTGGIFNNDILIVVVSILRLLV